MFMLLLVVVNIAIYFDFYMPVAENEMLKERNESYNKYLLETDKLIGKMDTLQLMVASIDTASNRVFHEQKVTQSIHSFNEYVMALQNPQPKAIGAIVVSNMQGLYLHKQKLAKLSGSEEVIKNLEMRLDDLEQKRKELDIENTNLRVQVKTLSAP